MSKSVDASDNQQPMSGVETGARFVKTSFLCQQVDFRNRKSFGRPQPLSSLNRYADISTYKHALCGLENTTSMAYHQFHVAQPTGNAVGHATRAGSTTQQPEHWHYDFSKGGFPQPPTFDDKLEERSYIKGRLAAAFRIFGQKGFDEGVAGHITVRVGRSNMWVALLILHRTQLSHTRCG